MKKVLVMKQSSKEKLASRGFKVKAAVKAGFPIMK